jgi:hypothetical protein
VAGPERGLPVACSCGAPAQNRMREPCPVARGSATNPGRNAHARMRQISSGPAGRAAQIFPLALARACLSLTFTGLRLLLRAQARRPHSSGCSATASYCCLASPFCYAFGFLCACIYAHSAVDFIFVCFGSRIWVADPQLI